MHFNYPQMIASMRTVLHQKGLLSSFKYYTPPISTGYTYDTSPMIQELKKAVIHDIHSNTRFSICCYELKENLQIEAYENKNLSTVVLTQNKRCITIPNINNTNNTTP